MTQKIIKIRIGLEASSYRIVIGASLDHIGRWAQTCLKRGSGRIAIVSNPIVFGLYGKTCERSLFEAGFSTTTFLMKDGERHKTLKSAEAALASFSKAGLTRNDAVVALGGGVVGDLAGFAASLYLRGISYLQVPTTLLAMIDSSVGGKTGVNTSFGKNLVGAFHQPKGVFIDPTTLSTLPTREMTAGLCEMIKHAALSGRELLTQTHKLLKTNDKELNSLIVKNIGFKAKVVANDERESPERSDGRSRKILNFGHTLAHGLEKATNYGYFRHGEAVGYGILFAAELSKSLALLKEKDVELLNDVLQCVGPLPSLGNIDEKKVLDAFAFDKKNVGGSLQMVLLKGIGKPVMVRATEFPRSLIQQTLKKLFKKWA